MKAISVRSLLILSIVLTMVSAVITYLNVQQKKEAISLVIHNYKVIQASTRLLSLLKDVEIGHRGYLITTDKSFLQPYEEAMTDINHDIDTLRLLVKDNPRQLEILQQKLIPMVDQKMNNLEESFAILKTFGRDSATHFSGMQIMKAHMDSIHFWTTNFIIYEQTLLKERSENLEQRYFINDVIRFSSFALIGVISLAALITIANKELDNKRLLVELQQFNQQLEHKVKERTRQLEDANLNLVRLNEEKNHFLGITTHDLKAPLAGISGLLELMKLEKAFLSPKHLGYIQLMEETSQDMLRLISDLLDLSHIEQGTTITTLQVISLPKLVGQLEDHFRTWLIRKNIRLTIENKSTKNIVSDQDFLLRILDNLISNAIKFSSKGKEVIVTIVSEESNMRFEIRDQGPGIRPDERNKLFQRFQKLSARPTDGESSSGLGLSIVKDLVELLNGRIEVESEVGKGTCFIIRFPYSF
ncbi:hypothetical protein BH10BAC4_BH10BAC4_19860 [soil metagenome]